MVRHVEVLEERLQVLHVPQGFAQTLARLPRLVPAEVPAAPESTAASTPVSASVIETVAAFVHVAAIACVVSEPAESGYCSSPL
jgi:hypothetical protein